MNRWFRVAGGVAMNLCFGSAYTFSIFLAPLQREFGWTRAQVSLAFTISIACMVPMPCTFQPARRRALSGSFSAISSLMGL